MKKRILYANANYEEIVSKNGYFVDKTKYIEKLELVDNAVFMRPRRFGKSLWCRILECYYNINQKKDFDRLFGHTYIGQNPTPLRNSFFVLHMDFSVVRPTGTIEEIESSFDHTCNLRMRTMTGLSKKWFKNKVKINMEQSSTENLKSILDFISKNSLPPLYIIIDEYDNFANQLIVSHKDHLYRELTADNSFLKTFFKTMKEGRKTGDIANVFITGVLPITMDDLASGFNIASFITLDPEFENMLGFTQAETDCLLDEIYRDYEISPATRPQVNSLIKNHYNGYRFVNPNGEAVYNSTILMYFLNDFTRYKEIPKHLTDMNLRTDISWVRRLTGSEPQYTEEFVDQLAINNKISYDDRFLVQKFDMHRFFEKSFFPISFFYLGMLTRHDDFHLKLPNLNMRQIFIEYFNEIHRIDVSTKYADMMQGFVNNPDLHKLFSDYWDLYISQLPEAIFQKVNENFYRTTFFELCSRFLSRWFTWNVERSYPQGRTDLEFAGKFHEKFADLRMVIEFKYYSNAEFKKFKTSIKDFKLQEQDTAQIEGYAKGLKLEYPEARVSLHVIYCFGNQGFRVFDVSSKLVCHN
ncbi:AAA family ATPase [Desulfobacterales bacterium HSG17]|nr:AAA family ATPase [Desulfobacterales bacterium HSG17]